MRTISTRSTEAAPRATLTAFSTQVGRSARRRWGLAGAAALAVLSMLLLLLVVQWSMRSPAVPPKTSTATVAEGSVIGTLPAAGVIERESPVRVGTALPGQVVAVRASIGDLVERGQVLARLDNLEQRAAGSPATPRRRRHEVTLAIDNNDGTLRPDLSVLVELPTATSERALNVPVSAIDRHTRTADGLGTERPLVWLVHGTAPPTPLPVEVGVGDGQRVEIRGDGLEPGRIVKLRTTAR